MWKHTEIGGTFRVSPFSIEAEREVMRYRQTHWSLEVVDLGSDPGSPFHCGTLSLHFYKVKVFILPGLFEEKVK